MNSLVRCFVWRKWIRFCRDAEQSSLPSYPIIVIAPPEVINSQPIGNSNTMGPVEADNDNCTAAVIEQTEGPPAATPPTIAVDTAGYLVPRTSDNPLQQDEIHKLNYERLLPEISMDRIEFLGFLGRGSFGIVRKAILRGEQSDTIVAAKEARDLADKTQQRALDLEVKLMTYLRGHRNVVNILGVARPSNVEFFIIVEYCENGSLEKFLKGKAFSEQDSDTSIKRLASYALQIADGMSFIHSKRCVHRDLATRNIVICEKGKMAKVTDFGMARELSNKSKHELTCGAKVPWAWSAPEYLRTGRFYFSSDVWSYGVLLWEMYSLGASPVEPMEKLLNFLMNVEAGWRWVKPQYCEDKMYSVMQKCWSLERSDRPSFVEIAAQLKPNQ